MNKVIIFVDIDNTIEIKAADVMNDGTLHSVVFFDAKGKAIARFNTDKILGWHLEN